jgi:hypothetical protein
VRNAHPPVVADALDWTTLPRATLPRGEKEIYSMGNQAYAADGSRRVEAGDSTFAGRADLMSALQAYSTRAFRAWLAGAEPALSARVDAAVKAALGPAYSDPGLSVTALSYARGQADEAEVYARNAGGESVRMPPGLAYRRK